MSRARFLPVALIAVLVAVCVPLGAVAADDQYVTVDSAEFDQGSGTLAVTGTTSDDEVLLYVYGDGFTSSYAVFDAVDGEYSGEIWLGDIDAGTYTAVAFLNEAVTASLEFAVSDLEGEIVFVTTSAYITYGETMEVIVTVTGNLDIASVKYRTDNSSVVTVESEEDGDSATLTLTGAEVGSASIIAYYAYDTSISATLSVTVVEAEAEELVYYFFIQMLVDADKVESDTYTQEMLETGFTISATGTNAAEALEAACEANGIPVELWWSDDGTYRGWIESLFGLGDVQDEDDSSVWTYWMQYHDGTYNSWTLGYYTDGGEFSLIYATSALSVVITGAPSSSIEVGDTVQLTAYMTPDNVTTTDVVWSSSDESVATVDGDGLVTAVSEGTATITAYLSDGVTDEVTITVVAASSSSGGSEDSGSGGTSSGSSSSSSSSTEEEDSGPNTVLVTAAVLIVAVFAAGAVFLLCRRRA